MNDQPLTKRQRRLLKKQQRQEEYLRTVRHKKTKKIFIIVLLVILIVGGLIFGLANYSATQNGKNNQTVAKIKISPLEYDAGTVSMSAGLVKHTYQVENIGQGDLKIDKIWTSCMCTTAKLRVGDKISSEFGMHSAPAFWSQKISPGEIGYLEVIFDPAFHGPSGVGLLSRAVYLSTNDPQNKKAEARLLINVIP